MKDFRARLFLSMVGALTNINSTIEWDSGQRKEITAEALRLTEAFFQARKPIPEGSDEVLNESALVIFTNLRLKAGEVSLQDDACIKLAEKAFSIAATFAEAWKKNA